MTRDEILLAKVKQLVSASYRGEITKLKKKLYAMEVLKNNWKDTAERRAEEIKELKEKLRDQRV